jgi:hypothetical protein|tara:strand:+ start:10696 stop:10803 length:108 start_codon:yes stop_codon:yes gene_type:complete
MRACIALNTAKFGQKLAGSKEVAGNVMTHGAFLGN